MARTGSPAASAIESSPGTECQPGALALSEDDRRVLAPRAADCAERTLWTRGCGDAAAGWPTRSSKRRVRAIEHYHGARPHQGLGQRRPCEPAEAILVVPPGWSTAIALAVSSI